METDEIRLISPNELARMLSVSTRTLWRWVAVGDLPKPVRIRGVTRWRLEEVLEWINQGCPPAKSRDN